MASKGACESVKKISNFIGFDSDGIIRFRVSRAMKHKKRTKKIKSIQCKVCKKIRNESDETKFGFYKLRIENAMFERCYDIGEEGVYNEYVYYLPICNNHSEDEILGSLERITFSKKIVLPEDSSVVMTINRRVMEYEIDAKKYGFDIDKWEDEYGNKRLENMPKIMINDIPHYLVNKGGVKCCNYCQDVNGYVDYCVYSSKKYCYVYNLSIRGAIKNQYMCTNCFEQFIEKPLVKKFSELFDFIKNVEVKLLDKFAQEYLDFRRTYLMVNVFGGKILDIRFNKYTKEIVMTKFNRSGLVNERTLAIEKQMVESFCQKMGIKVEKSQYERFNGIVMANYYSNRLQNRMKDAVTPYL